MTRHTPTVTTRTATRDVSSLPGRDRRTSVTLGKLGRGGASTSSSGSTVSTHGGGEEPERVGDDVPPLTQGLVLRFRSYP